MDLFRDLRGYLGARYVGMTITGPLKGSFFLPHKFGWGEFGGP